jgi:hypothetical protein
MLRSDMRKGPYKIWCPSESFSSVFSYLCQHRGELRYACPLGSHQFCSCFFLR